MLHAQGRCSLWIARTLRHPRQPPPSLPASRQHLAPQTLPGLLGRVMFVSLFCRKGCQALPVTASLASLVKSSIRCSGLTALGTSAGSTSTSLLPVCRLCNSASSVFIAIHGQLAQLRQLAPSPAVGASMKVLFGFSCCIL